MAQIGRYTLLRRVGVGGMAEVWKAKVQGPAGFEKVVAVKTILPHLLGDLEFIDMFVEEAKLVARLVHPNIVQVLDFGVSDADDGRSEYYITMEYVAGQNLANIASTLRQEEEALGQDIALLIVLDAAEALGFAHTENDTDGNALNIVHRDVSPHNVLVSYRGEVKVTDFGIAKVESALPRTGAGVWKGKMAYMSPEQIRIESIDPRSDVFSLGLVLYELVKGQRLFNERTSDELYRQVKTFAGLTDDMLAGIPWAIRDILQTALQLNPDDRYQNAAEVAQAVGRALGTARAKPARESLSALMQRLFSEELEEENSEDEKDPDSRIHRTHSWMKAIAEHEDSTAVQTRISVKEPDADEDDAVDPVTRISDTVISADRASDNLQLLAAESAPVIAPAIARAEVPLDDEEEAALAVLTEVGDDAELTPPPKAPREDEVSLRPRKQRGTTPKARISIVVTATVFLLIGLAIPRVLRYFEEPLDSLTAQLSPQVTETMPPDHTVPTPPLRDATVPTPVATATPEILKMALVRDPFARPGNVPNDATTQPTRVTVRRTPTPRPVLANVASGFLTVRARPWVQVWVDGRKVATETPVRRLALPAGEHRLRFINPDLKLQLDKKVKIPVDGELALFVDVQKGTVETR